MLMDTRGKQDENSDSRQDHLGSGCWLSSQEHNPSYLEKNIKAQLANMVLLKVASILI
jgi:hypothetical protein